MTISKDLFLSILSMDAYNRGYGVGIEMPSNAAGGSNYLLGNAQITRQSDVAEGTPGVEAGFYGVAYTITGPGYQDTNGNDLTAGDTVISYRGTNLDSLESALADALNGWGVGIGWATTPFGEQARLAAEFRRAPKRFLSAEDLPPTRFRPSEMFA